MGPIFHIQLLHPDTRHSCKKILAESHQKKVIGEKTTFRYVKVTFKGGRGRSKGGGVGKGMSEGAGVGGWGRGGGEEGEEEGVRER